MDGVGMNVNDKYFPGGWNPDHPSENVQYRTVDNEDGTGIYYEYDTDGTVLVQEDLVLPLPEVPVEEPQLVDATVVTGFANSVLDAQSLEEIRAAAAALIAALEE